MERLRDKDRDAIVLRFFENKSLREVGEALGLEERAAQKRVARGLAKLRTFFAKRGVDSTATGIAERFRPTQFRPRRWRSPRAFAAAITKGAAAGGTTLALVTGGLKIMAWTKAKTTIAMAAVVVLAAGTATPIFIHHYRASESVFTSTTELTDTDNANYQRQTGATPAQVARTFFEACSQQDWAAAANIGRLVFM